MGSPPRHDADTGKRRHALRRARRHLTPSEQRSHATAVSRHVSRSGLLNLAGNIGAYLANHRDGELDTGPLLSRLWAMGKPVSCPVTERRSAGSVMHFYRLAPGTAIDRARFGLDEPRTFGTGAGTYTHPLSLSLLFTPLVGFDDAGQRIGMGAGYYDRYLGRITPSLRPLVIGLAHEAQRAKTLLAAAPWDVPLDGVVTEAGWQPFSPRARRLSRGEKPG
ncbi:MAG: 5-formyltetrahydrofolate cyclo-ligase [Pseudomonadota bacterium]